MLIERGRKEGVVWQNQASQKREPATRCSPEVELAARTSGGNPLAIRWVLTQRR